MSLLFPRDVDEPLERALERLRREGDQPEPLPLDLPTPDNVTES